MSLGQDCYPCFPPPNFHSLEFHRHKERWKDTERESRWMRKTGSPDSGPSASGFLLKISRCTCCRASQSKWLARLPPSSFLLPWKHTAPLQGSLDGNGLMMCLQPSHARACHWGTEATPGVHQVHLMAREPGTRLPAGTSEGG